MPLLYFTSKIKIGPWNVPGQNVIFSQFLGECRGTVPNCPGGVGAYGDGSAVFLSGWEKSVIFDRCRGLCRIQVSVSVILMTLKGGMWGPFFRQIAVRRLVIFDLERPIFHSNISGGACFSWSPTPLIIRGVPQRR